LDMTKLEMSVNTDSLGSERRMLRICRRTPNHVQTSRVMCDFMDKSLSK